VLAPLLKFTGDTNTGIYSPGADQVAVSTGGTGRLFVDASGNVQIGSSFAGFGNGSGVEIARSTTSTLRLTGNSGVGCEFFNTGSLASIQTRSAIPFTIQTNELERLRITSAGLVGIGTSTPGSALEVKAAAPVLTVNSAVANASSIVLQENGTTYARFRFDGNNVDIGNLYVNGATIFNAGNAERARIDSSGRLLVGTSTSLGDGAQVQSVSAIAQVFDGYNFREDNVGSELRLGKARGGSSSSPTILSSGDSIGRVIFRGHAGATSGFLQAAYIDATVDGTPGTNDMPGRLVFSTTADGASSPTERMRITQAGHLYIANTTGDYNTVGITLFSNGQAQANANGVNPLNLNRKGSDGKIVDFYRDTNNPGSISVTTTATTYATSSDYRLKENVTPVTDGITRLQQLRPSRFNFIADPAKTVDGFIAHEAQAVVPECVTGTKDEVDADGNPIYQGIDQSKLVPLLTAALQEAIAKIEALEARLTAAGI
jgi:hypothetical protein